MKKAKTTFFLILSLLLLNQQSFAFSDIKEGSKHYVEINYLKENGIIEGYSDNTFKAKQEINRAEALKIFMESAKVLTKEEISSLEINEKPFTDTELSDWFTPYVFVAKEKGIINGYPDGSFKPSQAIKLVEALKIYLESYENLIYPLEIKNYFLDIDINEWYAKYVRYADSRDLVEIYPSNKIYPFANQTRGDIAGIMYRHLMSSKGNMEFGKATFYGKAVQGNLTASGERFDLNKATAAHKTLPFNTIVRVTNLANGKSVDVRITDRGPYGPGRIIDLSSSAFSEIAWLGTGIIHVQMEIISTP